MLKIDTFIIYSLFQKYFFFKLFWGQGRGHCPCPRDGTGTGTNGDKIKILPDIIQKEKLSMRIKNYFKTIIKVFPPKFIFISFDLSNDNDSEITIAD